MNKKILIVLIILIIILSIFLYSYSTIKDKNSSKIENKSSKEKEIIVDLGKEFTLVENQSAIIKELNVSLKIKYFVYSPCPEGVNCIWSGLEVGYELTVDGRTYDSHLSSLPPESPYEVFVKDTDFQTYATFIIDKRKIDASTIFSSNINSTF